MLISSKKTSSCLLMREYFQCWLEELNQPYLKQSTFSLYRRMVEKHLMPALGHLVLKDFCEKDVWDFIQLKLTSGRLDGHGGLSAKTVHELLVLLNSIIETAVRKKFLQSNPLREVKHPRGTEPKLRVFSPDEQKRLECAVLELDNHVYLGIIVCLYTGLRLGELCALKWENINFELGTIAVRQTLQRIENPAGGARKTKIVLDSAKSRHSVRTLPMTPTLQHKLLQYYNELPIGRKSTADFVFNRVSDGENRYIEPRLFEKYFYNAVRTAGIEKANFHALRHTFATRCVEFSMDAKSLSEILGHSNVSITLDRYVHSLMDQKRRKIGRLDNIIVV